MLARISALSLALVVAGCAIGPAYTPPDTAAAAFHSAEPALFSDRPFEAAWWSQFGDPVLDELVDRSLRDGLDVRAAVARIDEARSVLRGTRREQWPSAALETGYERGRMQQPVFGDERIEYDSYRLGFQPVWELDLLGRLRRRTEAAMAEAAAAEATLRDVQVLVAAEVVAAYVDLREAQKRLRVTEQNLANQRETLRLTTVRFELGRGSELDVASARASLAATLAQQPALVTAERTAAHRLAVLTGTRPGTLDIDLGFREMPPRLTLLAVGAPEELLRRRPDVRAAERRLAAATARTAVARTDLFPRVSLSGFLGFVAGDASELGESESRGWSITPALQWSAFDLGGARASLRGAEARTQVALADYEHTVLRALEDTENAFVAYAQQRERLAATIEQADASRRAAELARIRYREGALDFLRLLDAERTVLVAEDAVAVAEADLNGAIVGVYKALGGGWGSTAALSAAAGH